MKIEPRGKYPGVKVHLDEKECEELLQAYEGGYIKVNVPHFFGLKLAKQIKDLLAEEPDLLTPRTPEQVKAILAKEVEKAKMQLDQVNHGLSHAKVDKEALKKALLKHAE